MRFVLITSLITAASFVAAAQNISYMNPNWSSDGKWLAYTKMRVEMGPPRKMEADVFVMKPDGSGITRVVAGNGHGALNPVFSHDGKTLFYAYVDPETRARDIYSVGVDGSGAKRLTTTTRSSDPQLSPDGKWIAYNSTLTTDPKDHFVQIFVMRTDGSGAKQLTNDPTISFYNPDWSPDGKRLVYYLERGDNKDQIWSMKADGSDNKLLTANIGHNFYPSWSPDGKRIIFTSNRDGKQQLYVMTADGSDVKPLGIESAVSVRFSPDGKRIVYAAGKFPDIKVWVANADGSEAKQLLPEK